MFLRIGVPIKKQVWNGFWVSCRVTQIYLLDNQKDAASHGQHLSIDLEEILNRTREFADGTRIFNLDETATTTVIIAKKGIKQVSSATSGEREILVTTCCVISATGNFIPSAMVFPRKKFKERMLNGAPSATLGLAHSTG
jgi:hypothetical protein